MVLQALIEAEATEVIGAAPHQRSDPRTNPAQWRPGAAVVDQGSLEIPATFPASHWSLRRGSGGRAGASTGGWVSTATPRRYSAWLEASGRVAVGAAGPSASSGGPPVAR